MVEPTTTRAPKVVCQYRRARRLAAALAGAYGPDAAVEAESFSLEHWEGAAGWVAAQDGKPFTPPSADTTALTIELLREAEEA